MKKIKVILFCVSIGLLSPSCEGELDLDPLTSETPDTIFDDPEAYRQFIAKIYAGFAVTGQQGPSGNPDIVGFDDEGFTDYLRQYWQLQELSSEEAIIGWNDAGLQDFNTHLWTPSNAFISILYNRIYFQVGLANEFIRQASDANLSARGISGSERDEIIIYRAEARFLRALSYWHAIDLYGNVPFVDENQELGAFLPEQGERKEIFDFLVAELNEILPILKAVGENEYGRADKGAGWSLLAKLHLNAITYIGQDNSTDALVALNNILDSGYSLHNSYDELFLADNNTNGAENEIIFPIAFDGVNTQGYGAMSYLVHAPIGGSQAPNDYGADTGWSGLRTTDTFVGYFLDPSGATDDRANFYTDGQQLEITTVSSFGDGYLIEKFKNIDSNGQVGSDPTLAHPDVDYPMFRLADIYLMYAEAVLRGGTGGDMNTAVNLVNKIQERAYGDVIHNISAGDLTLDFLLAERARELHWEGHRRTDLIRFGRYDDLLWAFKGGVSQGAASEDFRAIFPIPFSDLIANPNLEQNPGY